MPGVDRIRRPVLRRPDHELVGLARSGDPRALEAIHRRYARPLRAYAARTLGTRHQEADDVVQDVFLYAHDALRDSDDRLELRPWLFWLTRNRCLDRLRKVSAESELDPERDGGVGSDTLAEVARREDLRRLVVDLARLPEAQRTALVLRELEGLGHDEIASVLDVSESASKMLVLRAREGLTKSADARDAACSEIRADLAAAHDRGTRPSERSRVHMRDCTRCRAYQKELKSTRRRLRALVPVGPFGWFGMAKTASVVGAVVVASGVTAYELRPGLEITASGRPAPATLLGAGSSVRAGDPVPEGLTVVRRQVRLPVERRPRIRSVTLTCPAGTLVSAVTEPSTIDKTSLFAVAEPLPYGKRRRITLRYRPDADLARPGRLTVGAVCRAR